MARYVQPTIKMSCRVYRDSTQTISDATHTPIAFNQQRWNVGGLHHTSSANLTGTVSKTSGSATLTGSGTSFTTELSVGQVIDVPGTAVERKVVIAIASNTSLTVNSNYSNTASGQTGTRVNTALVAMVPGKWNIFGTIVWAANSTKRRIHNIRLNGSTVLAQHKVAPNADNQDIGVAFSTVYQLSRWDYVEFTAYQDTGGNLDVQSSAALTPEFGMILVSD